MILLLERSRIWSLDNVYKSDGTKCIYLLLRSNLISFDRLALRNNKVSYAIDVFVLGLEIWIFI